ncbi:MAG TPA: aldehyde dehydrogenase (NADP(+)) [Streptosporangiaceae bacterium]|nr:aldehyde dehydrogenase (NADP(+)) [Streptosporangiaceae bacterium]
MTAQQTAVQAVNPRSGDPVGSPVPATTADELAGVLAAAAAAAGPFGTSAPGTRTALLRALAGRLDERAGELAALAEQESGLPLARLTGEVARTSGQLRLFAEVIEDGGYLEVTADSADPAAVPPRPELRRWLEPAGPVLIFAASNFPFAFSVLGGDTASALASGCPVIVKAHPAHPGLSRAVGELAGAVVAEQGLPAGVFAVIFGDERGVQALQDPRVRAAGFTGSTAGGRFLFDIAAGRPAPIPFYGELGSINPVVVTPAAAAARGSEIAAGFAASMTLGTGQFCTKPGLLFLPAGHGMEQALAAAVGGVAAAPMLNARIRDQFDGGITGLAGHAGVRQVSGGNGSVPEAGSWAAPALFATTAEAVAADPASLTREYFGPAALVVEYAGAADLHAALAAVEGSLTATVHAEPGDDFDVAGLLGRLRALAGRVIYNGWPTGVAVAWAMHHGGPWPATTSAAHTSVGATAIRRWLHPVCYQSLPDELLPEGLRHGNPWHLPRRLDGVLTAAS